MMNQAMIPTNSPLDRLRQREETIVRNKSTRRSAESGLSAREREIVQFILEKPMDYINSEAFYTDDAEREIYDDPDPIRRPDVTWYRPLMDDLTAQGARDRQGSLRDSGTVLLTAAIFIVVNIIFFILIQSL